MIKKSGYLFIAAFACLLMSSANEPEFPQADISNGIVHARFYLPDNEKGFYRGTRFDWSGNMPVLEYDGHSYCQQWFNNYTPQLHEAVMGPVESFSPLGYEDAKAGGHFVEIGVGVLSKVQDEKYSPFKYYPIVNNGEWKVKTKAASISFTHILKDPLYSYEYNKTETLEKSKPILTLQHTLKNTGSKTIETDVYNHNLFVMDKQPTGPTYEVGLAFNPQCVAEGQRGIGAGDIAEIKGNNIVFNTEIIPGKSGYSILQGYGNTVKDYDIKIENHHTGAAMRITADQPLSKFVFWGSTKIFSPEPYIAVSVKPGETFSWKISYELYTCKITD